MTKAEAALPMKVHASSLKEHKANQKREKQRRYRQNKSKREAQCRLEERRALKIRGNTVFYIPTRKENYAHEGQIDAENTGGSWVKWSQN